MKALTNLLEELRDETEGDEKISIGGFVDNFADRGFGPLLLLPTFVVLLPTGAIPGVPTTCAILLVLISGQLLFGKKYPWLPGFLKKASISREKFVKAVDKVKPVTEKIDGFLGKRLQFLTGKIAKRIVAGIVILLALVMVPLEAVPMAVFAPASAIALLALGLTAGDGVLMLLGFLVSGFAVFAMIYWWPF